MSAFGGAFKVTRAIISTLHHEHVVDVQHSSSVHDSWYSVLPSARDVMIPSRTLFVLVSCHAPGCQLLLLLLLSLFCFLF